MRRRSSSSRLWVLPPDPLDTRDDLGEVAHAESLKDGVGEQGAHVVVGHVESPEARSREESARSRPGGGPGATTVAVSTGLPDEGP